MEEDPFKASLPRYLFERVNQDSGKSLGDDTHLLYVNGAYRGDDEIGHLMADFCQPNPALIRHKGLRDRVEYLKKSEKGVREMCGIFEEIREKGREEGREEGFEEGAETTLLENIRSVVEGFGVSVSEAMDKLKVPEADRPRYLAFLEARGLRCPA